MFLNTKFSYLINDVFVDNVVCDLGFIFISFLCPKAHINYVTCKVLRVLGFVKRVTIEFRLSRCLKALFCVLVRPIIEFHSVVWNPHSVLYHQQIERVQRRFLNFANFKLNIIHPPLDYDPILCHLSLSLLLIVNVLMTYVFFWTS